jgi:hypothetical protein
MNASMIAASKNDILNESRECKSMVDFALLRRDSAVEYVLHCFPSFAAHNRIMSAPVRFAAPIEVAAIDSPSQNQVERALVQVAAAHGPAAVSGGSRETL